MVRVLLIGAALLALSACREGAPALSCAPPLGVEPLLAGERAMVVIGADAQDGAEALAAAYEIACAMAQRGGAARVVLLAPAGAEAPAGRSAQLLAAGADLAVETASGLPADGPARAEAAFQRVAALREGAPEAALIVVGAPEDAARAPLGRSGETWAPLAARLAQAAPVISLRAAGRSQPGAALRLLRFEDVPAEGAPLVFDGTLEAGPPLGS